MHSHHIQLIILCLFFSIEYIFPYYQRKRRLLNAILNVSLFSINRFIAWLFFVGILSAELAWTEQHSIGLLYLLPLCPAWMKTPFAIILLDLWVYLAHRANHTFLPLWRFHRLHHIDNEIDITSVLRVHPGEQIICITGQIIASLLFGITANQLILFSSSVLFAGFLYHSNIAFPEKLDRILRLVFVTPAIHRRHHLSLKDGPSANYSSFFSFWDHIFGTYRLHDHNQTTQPPLELQGNYFKILTCFLRNPLELPTRRRKPMGEIAQTLSGRMRWGYTNIQPSDPLVTAD